MREWGDFKRQKTGRGEKGREEGRERERDGRREKEGILHDPGLKGRPRSRRGTVGTMAQWYDARFLIRRYRVRAPDGALFARKTPSFWMALGRGLRKLPTTFAVVLQAPKEGRRERGREGETAAKKKHEFSTIRVQRRALFETRSHCHDGITV